MVTFANMLVLKVTKDCNLRCKYCYLQDKDEHVGEVIDYELYKKIIDKIVDDKSKADRNGSFKLIFHGGEPTIVGVELLSKMLDYAKSKFNEGLVNYGFGIQTNMTLINDDYAKLFHKYNVSVGLSFDGIKKAMNMRTDDHDTNFFLEKINILKKYNVQYGVLLVINKNNIDVYEESIEFVKNILKVENYKSNYVEDINVINNSDIEVSGEEFFNKVMKVEVDRFIEGKCFETNIIRTIEKFLLGEICEYISFEKSNCFSKACGAGINVIEMDPDGKIFFCGRYSKPFPEVFIYDANTYDFLDLMQLKRHLDFTKIKHELLLKTNCDICEADGICDHGCMAFSYSKYGEFKIREDLVCGMFKSLSNYLLNKSTEIFEAYLKLRCINKKEHILNINNPKIFRLKCPRGYNEIMNKHNISLKIKEGRSILFENKVLKE